jgi:hypothetical protein
MWRQGQFKASLSSQPHKGGVKNMSLNISLSIMQKYSLLTEMSKNDKKITQNTKRPNISKLQKNNQN